MLLFWTAAAAAAAVPPEEVLALPAWSLPEFGATETLASGLLLVGVAVGRFITPAAPDSIDCNCVWDGRPKLAPPPPVGPPPPMPALGVLGPPGPAPPPPLPC